MPGSDRDKKRIQENIKRRELMRALRARAPSLENNSDENSCLRSNLSAVSSSSGDVPPSMHVSNTHAYLCVHAFIVSHVFNSRLADASRFK